MTNRPSLIRRLVARLIMVVSAPVLLLLCRDETLKRAWDFWQRRINPQPEKEQETCKWPDGDPVVTYTPVSIHSPAPKQWSVVTEEIDLTEAARLSQEFMLTTMVLAGVDCYKSQTTGKFRTTLQFEPYKTWALLGVDKAEGKSKSVAQEVAELMESDTVERCLKRLTDQLPHIAIQLVDNGMYVAHSNYIIEGNLRTYRGTTQGRATNILKALQLCEEQVEEVKRKANI